jgi:hypothetical protein
MNEEAKLAYQFALELAKQLITLSTAILALTVTYTKDVVKRPPSWWARLVLAISWFCYLWAIWYGIEHIRSLTGSLEMASIERAYLSGESARIADSTYAAVYFNSDTDSSTQQARNRLADVGVIIGNSGKSEAKKQIRFFFLGTVAAVAYGFLLLISREKAANSSPSD